MIAFAEAITEKQSFTLSSEEEEKTNGTEG